MLWLIYCKIQRDHHWIDFTWYDKDRLDVRCLDCGMRYEDYREKMK